MPFTVDIEATNRCNAKCYFCPRDVTPNQGLMTEEVFDQALARTVEFAAQSKETFGEEVTVSICGLGEPLLNPRTPSFARKVHEAGLFCSVSTNATLLTEERAHALLDAGVQRLNINAGEEGTGYEDIYKLPFAKTEANILRFAELAKGRCGVRIVLVDHRREPAHTEHMRRYWSERGLSSFMEFEIMNRGGSLTVDDMDYSSASERSRALEMLAATGADPVCSTPFIALFVGWDGQYYLCCSDWQKEVPLGSVFETSFAGVVGEKLRQVEQRESVCSTCNYDPVNQLMTELRLVEQGDSDDATLATLLDGLVFRGVLARDMARKLGHANAPRDPDSIRAAGLEVRPRRTLPVTSA